MRNTLFATSLAVLVGLGSVGCKSMSMPKLSMPKMPWSRNAAKSELDSPALSHSAPTKPSDLARQAEGLAAAQVAGGEAVPFVPGLPPTLASRSAPTSYPSTNAPSFSQAPTSNIAATTPTPRTNLGSIQLPYDPNAVPPATNVSPAEPALASSAGASRYATTPTPTNTSPYLNNSGGPSPAAETPTAASRYSDYLASVQASQTPLPNGLSGASATNQIAAATEALATSAASVPDGRYAQNVTAVSPALPAIPSTAVPASSGLATTPVPAPVTVASTSPYRPGGTSSYPVGAASPSTVEIASRTDVSASSQVPNVNTPDSGELAPYPVTPQVPHYR